MKRKINKSEQIKKDLEDLGVVILFGTAVCKHWNKTHASCRGCISEKGCAIFADELHKVVKKKRNGQNKNNQNH